LIGGAKAHYDGIVAFSQTDFTEDLKQIGIPVLVMHGDDDQIVPLRRLRTLVGSPPQEWLAHHLQRLPARHADNAGGDDQCRPVGLREAMTS
jgi:pimeloyl-ACP methyl ester carboxylesterase